MEEDAMKLMEEMNRFEAEIASPTGLGILGQQMLHPRPIIGSNTFDIMQKKLETVKNKGQDGDPYSAMNLPVPPPPPPPSGFTGILNPIAAFAGIPPPPPPPPPLLIPHQVKPAPRPLMELDTEESSPPRGYLASLRPLMSRPVETPVVLSAAPTKYVNPEDTDSSIDRELQDFLDEIKREEVLAQKKKSKLMADSVRASTTVSVQPIVPYMLPEDDPNYQKKKDKRNRKLVRLAGGQSWEDPSLAEWEDDDFRIFCGDLGNDVTDEVLTRAFSKYTSFLKAKVVRDKRTNKTKGFGFVSFKDPQDFTKAMKEMNGRYVGSRPIKLRKSTWKARSLDSVKKKEKEKAALISILTGR